MSKQNFIALADAIRHHNKLAERGNGTQLFSRDQIDTLAQFCRAQNGAFNYLRWIGYIDGLNGPNGGTTKNSPAARTRTLITQSTNQPINQTRSFTS